MSAATTRRNHPARGLADAARRYVCGPAAAAAILAALLCPAAPAADLTWDPDGSSGGSTGGTGTWNTSDLFWDNAGSMQAWNNVAGDTAIFGGTAGTVTLGEAISAGGLQFLIDGYTLTADTLTLAGAIAASGDATISSAMATGGTQTYTVDAGKTLTFDGAVSGESAITSNGAGTLLFSGSGTLAGGASLSAGILGYGGTVSQTGTTTVSGGTLRLADTASTGGISMSAGGSLLVVSGADATTGAIQKGTSVGGGVTIEAGATLSSASYAASWNPSAGLTVDGTWNIDSTLLLSVAQTTAISGSGTINAAGYVNDNFTTANISVNRFNIGASGISRASGTINLDGTTIGALADWSTSAPLVLASTSTFDTLNAADGVTPQSVTLSGGVSGSGGLTKSGGGTLTLSAASPFSGAAEITGGTLRVSNTLRGVSSMTVSNAATLELGATNIFVGGHGAALDAGRVLTANAGTLLMNSAMDSRIGNVTLNDGSVWTSDRALTAYDVLLANVSTGAATVTVSGNGPSVMNGSGGIHLQGVQNFDVAETTGNRGADLTVSMTLAAQGISGGAAGGVNKLGAGTMVLLAAPSYTGETIVNAGTLQLGDNSATGAITGTSPTSTLGGGGTVTVNFGSTLSANNAIGPGVSYLANTLAGFGTLEIAGAGHFGLSGNTNTFGGTVAMKSSGQVYGGLTLDYTEQNNNKLDTFTTLDLGGGNLQVIGNASGATSQSVGNVTVSGGNFLTLTPGSGQTVSLTATSLSQGDGGMLTLRTDGTLGTDASLNIGFSTLGRWATVQSASDTGTQFATTDGLGNVLPLAWTSSATGGTPLASAGVSDVYLADSAQTITTSQTIDSLGLSADVNLDSNAVLTLSGGGIVFRDTASTLGQSGGRGAVASGAGSGDLYVTSGGNHDSAYAINAEIVDNGFTPTRLVKGGSGQLILGNGGTNGYTGGTVVAGGRLRLNNAGALGSGTLDIRPGGQVFAVVGSNTIANNLILAGLGSADGSGANYGALRIENSTTFSGNVSIPEAARINVSGSGSTASFTGVVSGSGDLELRSLSGGLSYGVFTNPSNTFSGRWIVRDSGAVLRMASDAAFGPAPFSLVKDSIVLDGGRMQFGSTGSGASFTLDANRGIWLPTAGVNGFLHTWGGQTMTIAGPIGGLGNLYKTDGGTTVLQGTNTVSGIARVEAGTLNVNNGGSFTGLSQFQIRANFGLETGSSVTTGTLRTSDGPGGTTVITHSGGDLVVTGSNNSNSTGASLLLAHWAALTTYNLSGGSLVAPDANMLFGWDGSVTFNQSGGTVSVQGINLNSSRNNAASYNLTGGLLELGSNGIFNTQGVKTLNLGAGTLGATADWTNAAASLNLTDDTTGLTVDPSGNTITLGGVVGGTGKLALDGKGTLSLGAANTFAGGTEVRSGRLLLTTAAALPAAGVATISGGTVDIDTANADLGDTVTLTGGTITGTTGQLTDTPLTIQGGTLAALAAASSSVTKTGSGTATLAAAIAAPLDVQAGTLLATAGPAGTVTLTGGTLEMRAELAATPTFSGGDLAFGSGGSLAAGQSLAWSQGTVSVASGGTLAANNELAATGTGQLVVTGTGTVASAIASVTEGAVLDVSGINGFSWAAGQTLAVGRTGLAASDVLGDFTLAGGTLSTAGAGTAGTATFADSLVLAGGTVNLDLSNDPTTGANDFISVLGALDTQSSTSLQITKTDGALGSGTYDLFGYGAGSSINTANLSLAGTSGGNTRQTFTLADDTINSLVTLTVAGSAGNLVWEGTGTAAWDFTATDWDNGGSPDRFYDLDNVTFDDTATGSTTVDVTVDVSPNAIAVDNSVLAYTLQGAGKITGPTGLTKSGSGTLTLANTGNDFTGTTSVTAGTLALGVANALSAASGLDLSAGATLDLAGNSATALRLAGSGDVTSATAATLTLGDALSTTFAGGLGGAASLEKVGSGILTFTGTSTSSGSITVAGGSLLVGSGGTSGSLGSTSVALADGTTLRFNRSDKSTASGGISRSGATGTPTVQQAGSGDLELAGAVADVALSLSGSGGLTLSGGFSGAGSLTVGGTGSVVLASAATHTGGTTVSNGGLVIGDGGTAGSLAGDITNNASVIFNRSDASAFGGVISGTGDVQHFGSGTTTLSGINTYAGGTSILAGTLSVASAGNLGSGGLALSQGGTLATTESFTTGRAIALGTGGGAVDVAAATTLTHNGGITGGETLTKTGDGALNLSGYGGGSFGNSAIVVDAGTLRFTSGNFGTNIGLTSLTVNAGATASTVTHAMGGYFNATPSVTVNGGTFTFNNEQYLSTMSLTDATVNGGGQIRTDSNFLLTVSGGTSTWSTGINGVNSAMAIQVDAGAELAVSGGIISGQPLTKSGSGTLSLSAANTYTGGTTISAGTLRALNASALGTGNVTVADGSRLAVDAALTLGGGNAVSVAAGGVLEMADLASLPIAAGSSLAGLLVTAGPTGTTAEVLAGTSAGGTVSTAWTTDTEVFSDVLDITTGSGTIDPFVLSMTYDAGISPGDEANAFLFWNSTPGSTATWVNAVDGNLANNASLAQQGYLGSFADFQTTYGTTLTDYMGAYGRDAVTDSVWAVVNHNSEFAVSTVPEPGTFALLAGVAAAAGLAYRRRVARRKL